MRSPALRAVLAVYVLSAFPASAVLSPEHFSPPVESLATSSDLIILASVPIQRGAESSGTVTVVIEELWKGNAPGSLHVTSSAPWMKAPWAPRAGERFVLFLQSSGSGQPYRLLDLGASYFRVSPFSPPVVDVWPGLMPGTVLAGASCRRVPLLAPDGTITYKKVCTGALTTPLSVLRQAVAGAVARSSGTAVSPA